MSSPPPLGTRFREQRWRWCPCGAVGRPVWFIDHLVIFWRRNGVWWRDDAPDLGRLCGYCGVASSRLVYEGWATPQRRRS